MLSLTKKKVVRKTHKFVETQMQTQTQTSAQIVLLHAKITIYRMLFTCNFQFLLIN